MCERKNETWKPIQINGPRVSESDEVQRGKTAKFIVYILLICTAHNIHLPPFFHPKHRIVTVSYMIIYNLPHDISDASHYRISCAVFGLCRLCRVHHLFFGHNIFTIYVCVCVLRFNCPWFLYRLYRCRFRVGFPFSLDWLFFFWIHKYLSRALYCMHEWKVVCSALERMHNLNSWRRRRKKTKVCRL